MWSGEVQIVWVGSIMIGVGSMRFTEISSYDGEVHCGLGRSDVV